MFLCPHHRLGGGDLGNGGIQMNKYDKMSNEDIEALVASMRIGNKQPILFTETVKGYCFKKGIVYSLFWREADRWVKMGRATYEFEDEDENGKEIDYEIVEMKYDWDVAVQRMQKAFYEEDEDFNEDERDEALAAYDKAFDEDEDIEDDNEFVNVHNEEIEIVKIHEPEKIRIETEKDNGEKVKVKQKRDYSCKTCGEDYGSPRGLGSHYKSNPDHKPYKSGWKSKVMNTALNTENVTEK